MFFSKAKKILGMNARNLNYTMRYNSREHKKFTVNKLFTKNFLSSRGIRVAKTFHAVTHQRQLTQEFFDALPDSFVVKPNKGFGGAGILVFTEKKGSFWYTASRKKCTKEQLFQHCISILDGKYSLSNTIDSVIFEERLEKHPSLRNFTDTGLPDIRVIVFNKIPVMAMMRVPTHESDGKANMELGAVGIGIDIGTGKTTFGAKFSNIVSKMPNGFRIKDFQIPFWETLLLSSAKIQHHTGIGYLGIDFVLTKSGVKVLELNSLAGLKIQIANKTPLKQRLEKVQDLRVKSPEEGVEIAKTLFSQKSAIAHEHGLLKPVIGHKEAVLINQDPPLSVFAGIDTLSEENKIYSDLYTGPVIDITLAGKRLKLPVVKSDTLKQDLILAGKYLTDFLIDPSKQSPLKTPEIIKPQIDEKMIHNVDEKICEIDEKIKLLSYINPQNLYEQKELFLANPEFSPRFFYRPLELDTEQFRRDLKKIPQVNHPLFPLFKEKALELEDKISLIESVGTPDFQNFSERLFGSVSAHTYRSALKFLEREVARTLPDESEKLDAKTTIDIVKSFLETHHLSHWKIALLDESAVDMQVTKRHSILIRKNATFTRNRLDALLVHEIGTHVFRFENGKRQPFRIFERGTAGYLRTEEGLAIWNQNKLQSNLGEKFLTPALQIIAIYLGKKMTFLDLFQYIKNTYPLLSDDLVWKLCIKAKRGLTDTSEKHVFTKDALYFKGLLDIERYTKDNGSIDALYMGKITLKDLPTLKNVDGLLEAKFLL